MFTRASLNLSRKTVKNKLCATDKILSYCDSKIDDIPNMDLVNFPDISLRTAYTINTNIANLV